MIEEYDVSFAVKEWLLKHGWNVVAFNPPGSQGTFTIPNPLKDPKYRGQTDSDAPDIIAVKNNFVWIIESKSEYNQKDVDKLIKLSKDTDRIKILTKLLDKVCKANKIEIKHPITFILGKAHGGRPYLREDLSTFLVSTSKNWNPKLINPKLNPYDFMQVTFKESNKDIGKIV